MMTVRRFKTLAESYGADLQRWPAEAREDARMLLGASAAAQAVLAEARRFDAAIGAARRQEEAALWQDGEQDAALARLRAGVAARIAPAVPKPAPGRLGWTLSGAAGGALQAYLGWLGLATGSGFAVAAGLLIGSLSVSAPAPDNVLAILQTAPIHLFAE